MASHKFIVGQEVEFLRGRADFHVPPGIYTVVRQLPIEANDCQYQVKNARDGHQRVVRESQLAGVRSLGWVSDKAIRPGNYRQRGRGKQVRDLAFTTIVAPVLNRS